ncbi:MAG: FRG domain-containing protein [Phycisphaeraceae bacterium]|nr:FRG domain-containing protein [Phycisphaeraceae bacterium]
MAWTQVKPRATWEELRDRLNEVAKCDQLSCRGQAKDFGEGALYSSLDRVFRSTKVSGKTAIAIERIAIQRFLQQAPNYLSVAEQTLLDEGPSLLMLMRHYGGPTRLLDWTESLWIALFNACDGCWDSDGVIWAFRRDEFDKVVMKKYSNEVPFALQSRGLSAAPVLPAVTVLELSPWVCRLFPVGPRIPRLIAQQGAFTIGSQLGMDHAKFIDEVLPETPTQKWKIVVSKDVKRHALKELAKMGITASAHFPGVDGVGKYLETFTHFAHLDQGVKTAAASGWGELNGPPSP